MKGIDSVITKAAQLPHLLYDNGHTYGDTYR